MNDVRQGLSAFATAGLALTILFVPASDALAQRVNQVDLSTASNEQVRIGQRTGDQLGQQVAVGDFNGDGRPDYAVGAPAYGGPGNGRLQCGAVYVFYGRYPADRTIDLAAGSGPAPDLVIYGPREGNNLGEHIAFGDLNRDGTADLVMSAPGGAGPTGIDADGDGTVDPSGLLARGEVYVLYGGRPRSTPFDLRRPDPTKSRADLWILGVDAGDRLGGTLAIGDVDGDGSADLVMGAIGGDGAGNGRTNCGEVHILLGSSGAFVDGTRNLRTQPANALIYGPAYDFDADGTFNRVPDEQGSIGGVLATGRMDADARDDVAIQLPKGRGAAATPRAAAGEVVVVLGASPFPATTDLNVSLPIRVYGGDPSDVAGADIAFGDVDGDGQQDLLIGAPNGDGLDSDGTARLDCGEVAVVWGPRSVGTSLDLKLFPSGSGFLILGKEADDGLGQRLALGDLDADGRRDLVMSAPFADGPDGLRLSAGELWVRYGDGTKSGSNVDFRNAGGPVIWGRGQGDTLGLSLVLADIDKDGTRQEILVGAPFADYDPDGTGAQPGRDSPGFLYITTTNDRDVDTIRDTVDNCPTISNVAQSDLDSDLLGDFCDNCQSNSNRDQANADLDAFGDVCDSDDDNDTVPDDFDMDGTYEPCTSNQTNACDDNCRIIANRFDPTPQEDSDLDGVGNKCDNCPSNANANQANADKDAQGDVCDPDDDNDGIADATDRCPSVAGPNDDADGDGKGDICDNCPSTPNADQLDTDGDGAGNACDNCPGIANPDQDDPDADGRGGSCDNCPNVANVSQTDTDGDSLGDACDNCVSVSNVGQLDSETVAGASYECPFIWIDANGDLVPQASENWLYLDTDRDGTRDANESLTRGPDGVGDACDNCSFVCNPSQSESSGFFSDTDKVGAACDNCAGKNNGECNVNALYCDANGDGTTNSSELATGFQKDSDGDAQGDACDSDDDGDGVSDTTDKCPLVPNPDQADTDGDGKGNVCDNCPNTSNASQTDGDGDGYGDPCDNCPAISNADQLNADGDGSGNACDTDDDNDGILDDSAPIGTYNPCTGGVTTNCDDNCQFTANANQADADSDGIGNVCDFTDVNLATDTEDFVVYGAELNDNSGRITAVGDLNGDGRNDVAIAAPAAKSKDNLRDGAGEVYILFGPFKNGEVDLKFRAPDVVIYGERREDQFGAALAIGDVTGDGTADLVAGASNGNCFWLLGQERTNCGRVYVLAGRSPWPASIDLFNDPDNDPSDSDDNTVPAATAAFIARTAGDSLGRSLALADLNADGRLDICMGAPNYFEPVGDPPKNVTYGGVFVKFGGSSVTGTFNFGPNTAGGPPQNNPDYLIKGADEADRAGRVLAAGDVNADGTTDLLVGAPGGDGPSNGKRDAGQIHIVFGGSSINQFGKRDLATAPDPYIYGVDNSDLMPTAMAVGNANGAGAADIVIGVSGTSSKNNSRLSGGEGYIILGRTSWTTGQADTLASKVIWGRQPADFFGQSVAVGEVDGDGSADFAFGATGSEGPQGQSPTQAGEVTLLSWKDISALTEVDLVTAKTAASIRGANAVDQLGAWITIGDMNRDLIGEVLASSEFADGDPDDTSNSRESAGEVWIVGPSDADGDGLRNLRDNCPRVSNVDQLDGDGDGVGDLCDNCPTTPNPGQEDDNNNGIGNICENDPDRDNVPDSGKPIGCVGGRAYECNDNCLGTANPNQSDIDGDGTGDACETDDDGDGILDATDKCPTVSNASQADADGDGTGNACELVVRDLAGGGIAVYGKTAGARLGGGGVVGDFNRDGTADLLVGSPYASPSGRNEAGAVYMWLGPIPASEDLATTTADYEIYGQRAGDHLGWAVAAADVSGDGTDDMIFSAPDHDGSAANKNNAGVVYVKHGPATGTLDLGTASANRIFRGNLAGDRLGVSVLAVDFNGDGKKDLVMGSPNGSVTVPNTRTGNGEIWGIYQARLGSVTDITTGNVDLYAYGAANEDRFGAALAGGDVTGDGTEDVIVGAPDADGSNNLISGAGELYVLRGGTSLLGSFDMNVANDYHGLIYGERADDRVGAALAVERWDTDTARDILVGAAGRDGAPGASLSDSGAAFVVRGRDFSTIKGKLLIDEATLAVYGDGAGGQLGKGVAFADFDNDGSADLLFGAPFLDGPAGTRADAGAVLILARDRVRTGTAVVDLARQPAAQVVHGRNAGDQLGFTGWVAVAKLSGGATRDVVSPAELGDGPVDTRASAGEAWIVPQADQDRDGALDSLDTCFPTDPTKADPAPTGTSSVWTSRTTFQWSVVSNATSYNFYRGTVVKPWSYNWTCLQKNLTTPIGTDTTSPPAGQVYWYDSIALYTGCTGRPGNDSSGQPRPQPPACP